MNTPDTHPLVIWTGVVVAILTAVGIGVRRLVAEFQPAAAWFATREVRRMERQRQLELAAQALNDARVDGLSVQLTGVADQMERNSRQSREDAEAYQEQIRRLSAQLAATQETLAATQAQLREALSNIESLRRELNERRNDH